MTPRTGQALGQRAEPRRQAQEADMCPQASPAIPEEFRALLPVVRRIAADARQVTMPRGFGQRVWQKIVAPSSGSLLPRSGKGKT